jgi:hypothetical protein
VASFLVETRRYTVVFKSKPDAVRYPGHIRARTAEALDNQRLEHIVLDPKYERQWPEFSAGLEKVWHQGGWTVALDELLYLDRLGLRKPIERLLTQGRSKGISVLVGMQRPAQVTRFAISESMHVLSFGLEGRDAKELGLATQRWVGDAVSQLGRYEFAWYRRPDRLWVGKLDLKTRALVGEEVGH